MGKRAMKQDRAKWHEPQDAGTVPEAGYDAWLAREIAAGRAELDAGKGVPAEQVWRDLGLE